MKLNPEQLNRIKRFISKRGFTAIDLQMEIIDHVACRIEDKLQANPKLDFEQALQQTHAEFGVFGFSTLEEALIQGLNREYRNQISLELKTWLTWPHVLATAGTAVLLYQLFFIISPVILIASISAIYMAIAVWQIVWNIGLRRRYRKMMAMQIANTFVFFPSLILQLGLPADGNITAHWTWASTYTLVFLIFAFLFAATFRVTNFAVARCRKLEEQYVLHSSR